jgi:predicted nucleic acid-binding Zn ribbon protein
MRRHTPRRISLALDDLAGSLAPATTLARTQQVWASAVGSPIAEAGLPSAEREGVLTVTCTDAVWAAELDMMGSQVVTRLNEALGEDLIRRLRCRTG